MFTTTRRQKIPAAAFPWFLTFRVLSNDLGPFPGILIPKFWAEAQERAVLTPIPQVTLKQGLGVHTLSITPLGS